MKRSVLLLIGLALLVATACAGGDDDQEGNAGLGGEGGGVDYGGAGMAGMAGGVAGGGGIAGSLEAGTGGEVAGTGGEVAGTGGVEAGTGGIEAGTGGVEAGTGGVEAGTGGDDVGGAGGTSDIRPPCLNDPSQVVLLGDSYMNAPSWVGRAIADAAIADGALQPGESYNDYSAPGATVLSGQIPGQLDEALADNPNVKTYIATGCGNDIIASVLCLLPGSSQNTVCTDIIAQCTQAFMDMGTRAQAAGVTDAIVFYYPDNVPGGGAEIAQYGAEAAATGTASYSTPEFRAYFVDSIPLMQSHPDWYLDLIHVNADGAKLIGDAIYQVMKDNCIAQPESSGCCEPW